MEKFEDMLTGGHPNSLGRTIEVVDAILATPERFDELYNCYKSTDEVVRLRVSNAIRRVQAERPEWLLPYLDRLIDEIGALDQASAQWTLAKLFEKARPKMSDAQATRALALLKRNLAEHNDWIVLNNTSEVLAIWAETDEALRVWLLPHLKRLTTDKRKSVSGRAAKLLQRLES